MSALYFFLVVRPQIFLIRRRAVGTQQMTLREIHELSRILLLSKPRQAVEIGSFCGITSRILAWCLSHQSPSGRLYCIDPFKTEETLSYYGSRVKKENLGYSYEEAFDHNTRDFNDVIVKLKGFSSQVSLPGDFAPSFVFIDGNHTAEGVKADIDRYVPLVPIGGYICFHDFEIGRSGTITALLQTIWPAPNKSFYNIVSHLDSLLVIRKVAETPPSGYDLPI